jgi:hypothetical protein
MRGEARVRALEPLQWERARLRVRVRVQARVQVQV